MILMCKPLVCLQQLKADNEQLQSNNDLLQIRLSSLLGMFSIQEAAAAAKEASRVCMRVCVCVCVYVCVVI